nr:MFS transporter [Aneurinibacillus tyrosinisolvens]
MSFAAVLYCLRYFACSLAPDPRWIVYLQLLQGCTFVVFYTAAIQYLYAIVPEEWKSTGQTMLAVLFFGVLGIIGSFLGGWIFDAYGGAALYLTMSVLSFFGFLFSFLMRDHHTESRREQE